MSINDLFFRIGEGFGFLFNVEHGFWWWLWIFAIAMVILWQLEADDEKNRKDK